MLVLIKGHDTGKEWQPAQCDLDWGDKAQLPDMTQGGMAAPAGQTYLLVPS